MKGPLSFFRSLRFLVLLVLAVILPAGCGGRGASREGAVREVRVDWLGNHAFRITSSIGTSILTDPFAAGTGGHTLPSPLKPDIILISHESRDANNSDAADNQPVVFRGSMGVGVNNANGLAIRGTAVCRDPENESADGMNIIYSWAMDGMRFCFLGSLSRSLTPSQVSQLGTVDILFVPVGGSLGSPERDTVLMQIRPRLVVPMGHAAGWTYGSVRSVEGHSVLLSRPALPLQTTTLLFGS